MRFSIVDNVHIVTLSRRNILGLLAKLDGHPPNSKKTLARNCEGNVQLIVHAEEDDEHYNTRAPGEMVQATELAMEFLKKEKELIDEINDSRFNTIIPS